MRKTFACRIKITKTGKVKRRKMASSHFKSKKSSAAKQARRKKHNLNYSLKSLKKQVRN